MGHVIGLVHCLARFRPGAGSSHPYCAMMINQTPELAVHRDDYNFTLHRVRVLETKQVGGHLWIDAGSGLKQVEPLMTSTLSAAGLAVPDGIEVSRKGHLVCKRNALQCFDSRRPGVCPVSKGERFSISLFTPRRLSAVPWSLWKCLQALRFPGEKFMPDERCHQH
eukprot:2530913-Amphidinium_carterae.2